MKNNVKRLSKKSKLVLLICMVVVLIAAVIGIAVSLGRSSRSSRNSEKETSSLETTTQPETEVDSDGTEESPESGDGSREETGGDETNSAELQPSDSLEIPSETIQAEPDTETPAEAPTEGMTEAPVDTPVASSVEQRAKEILAAMSIEEKVGQMFISRCPESNGVAEIQKYHLGGYILFARDFENEWPSTMKERITSYQTAGKIGMLMGVDEEGGTVVRVSRYPQFREERFDSPMHIYQAGGTAALINDTREKSSLLTSLGVNMNFAPVCDLPDTQDAFMYDRSLGLDVNVVVEGVSAIVKQMNTDNVISVLKHFPGYGNNVDTHTGVAVDTRDMQEFRNNDFRPFQAGIQAGAPCIMVSHNIINCMDDKAPASLSAAVHDVLRKELGFQGVIVTDDLSMDAITLYAGSEQAAVLAVQAGNDLLCVSDYRTQVPAVLEAVQNGKLSEERINESVLRILIMKLNYGITR